jgi:hypothetical protein
LYRSWSGLDLVNHSRAKVRGQPVPGFVTNQRVQLLISPGEMMPSKGTLDWLVDEATVRPRPANHGDCGSSPCFCEHCRSRGSIGDSDTCARNCGFESAALSSFKEAYAYSGDLSSKNHVKEDVERGRGLACRTSWPRAITNAGPSVNTLSQ